MHKHNLLRRQRSRLSLVFAAVAVCLQACGSQTPPEQASEDLTKTVEVNWTWKRTVKNDINVVYGTVRNKSDRPIQQVTLEFRTQNTAGETVFTSSFPVDNLPAGEQKPFTRDFPAASTQEDSGFVTVKKVIRAD